MSLDLKSEMWCSLGEAVMGPFLDSENEMSCISVVTIRDSHILPGTTMGDSHVLLRSWVRNEGLRSLFNPPDCPEL